MLKHPIGRAINKILKMEKINKTPEKVNASFNKFIYMAFCIFAVYFILFQKDYSSAASNLGIALAFDPFNQNQPWQERPKWQRALLVIHLAVVALLFGLAVGLGDKL